jgi:hypothetical protein
MLRSSPYYDQANRHAESTNKVLIKLIKKKIEAHRRWWHEVLSEALWDHIISRHGETKVIPFELVYGRDIVLLVKMNLAALRFAHHNDLSAKDYHNLMVDNIDEVANRCLMSLHAIEKEKFCVAKNTTRRFNLKNSKLETWSVKLSCQLILEAGNLTSGHLARKGLYGSRGSYPATRIW